MLNISIGSALIDPDPFFSESSGLFKDTASTVKAVFLDVSELGESKQGLPDNSRFPTRLVAGQ